MRVKHGARCEALSDALLHELMAGDAGLPSSRTHRLRGWVDAAQLPADALAGLWAAHRDTLSAEATTASFVCWGAVVFDRATDTVASRKARTTWSQRFHHERGY